jgi:subtilisin
MGADYRCGATTIARMPKTPSRKSGSTPEIPWTVTVHLDDAKRTPLPDALVTLMIEESRAIGLEATTDGRGRARFRLGPKIVRLQALHIDPLHGGWPVVLDDVAAGSPGVDVAVPPLDLRAADARGLVYGKPPARAGRGVAVAVVDTGVGRHAALSVAGGRNTAAGSPRRIHDRDGHGTHVAGVIASTAAGWRRGEAAGVSLRAYRIFEDGADVASNFAISAAIRQAAFDGCDLVNLSIGGSDADPAVRDAIELAWSLGCVCVAAAGNEGRAHVDHPARYAKVLAVSATGLEDSWPAGAALSWTVSRWHGKEIAGRRVFLAGFSNHGAKVALTAPGVAIVSTVPGDRWGVMSGTSMAAPIVTGVLARRLAASPVLALPRDAARSAAIVALAAAHAEDAGLHAHMQGAGLAR